MGLIKKIQYYGIIGVCKKLARRVMRFFAVYLKALFVEIFPKKISENELKEIVSAYPQCSKEQDTDVNSCLNGSSTIFFKPSSFFISIIDRDRIVNATEQYFSNAQQKSITKAEDAIRLSFSFLGQEFQYDKSVNWHNFPDTSPSWPLRYYALIPYKGEKIKKDIKTTWELNRHQYFPFLGMAYWMTNEQKYADEFFQQIASWVKANPVDKGVNWLSSLEVGLREISWICSYYFFEDLFKEKPEQLKVFLGILVLKSRYIENNLSLKDTPNNHLVGEACALVFAGFFFEKAKTSESKRWFDTGLRILEKQIDRQFYSDGVNKEQAMSYHRFSLDCYILVYILLYKNNISIPDKIANYIEKSLEFIMFSIKPNGECPYFGDSDNARPLFLSFYDYKQYSGSLALGAVLFNRGDMKWVAKCFHEEALWLLGVGSIDKFRSIKGTPPSEGSKAFPDGGYYIMRSSWDDEANYMFFDCGPLGLGRASSHGHADALSFELYCGGRSVFVDPGTYVYNANRKWRDYFRSTMAHNTATVDSRNQSVIKSRMEWEGSANATVNRWITCEHFDVIDAQHDGYTHLKNPVIHRRIVFFNKQRGYWVIKDLFIGKGEHTFSVNYHCRPDENIRQESNNFFLTRKNSEILLTVTGEKEIKTKVVMGQKEPIMGWYSEGYGEKVPAPVINIEWQGTTPTSLLSFISPYQGGDVGAQINCIIGGKLSNHTLSPLAVEVKRNGLSDVIIILDEDKCSFENNDILFEGELLHFSKSTDNIKNIFFSNAYSINISGRNVLNSTTPKSNFSKNEN